VIKVHDRKSTWLGRKNLVKSPSIQLNKITAFYILIQEGTHRILLPDYKLKYGPSRSKFSNIDMRFAIAISACATIITISLAFVAFEEVRGETKIIHGTAFQNKNGRRDLFSYQRDSQELLKVQIAGGTVTQPLDHFNPLNVDTFEQVYT
jgi:hypothetical protein